MLFRFVANACFFIPTPQCHAGLSARSSYLSGFRLFLNSYILHVSNSIKLKEKSAEFPRPRWKRVAEGTQRSKWHLLLVATSLRNNHCIFYIPVVFNIKLLVSSTSHEGHCLLSCEDCLETMPQLTCHYHIEPFLFQRVLDIELVVSRTFIICGRFIVTCIPDS
jgi:hypothetical protein